MSNSPTNQQSGSNDAPKAPVQTPSAPQQNQGDHKPANKPAEQQK